MKNLRLAIYTLILYLTTSPATTFAQIDSAQKTQGIQVSLLTCGTGPEIYSVFGHSAVRIIDSIEGTDIVYNYGTFDGYDEHFEMKFIKGKLPYYISTDLYNDFIEMYEMEGRWVEEQLLNTSNENKRKIQQYLLINMLPENRAYQYDFFYDNCATRIRDIFTQSLGEQFKFATVTDPTNQKSFRDIINHYLQKCPWERLGINILLGSKIDKLVNNDEIMFIPDYLQNAVFKSTLGGMKFSGEKVKLLEEEKNLNSKNASITLLLSTIFLLTLISNLVSKLKPLAIILNNLWLIVSGLLGLIIIVMWFGTDHKPCAQNFNLLWAIPVNLLFIFRKKQYKYALVAIILILLSFLLHFLGIQKLLLPEMLPILGSLLIVFIAYYTKAKNKADAKNRIEK